MFSISSLSGAQYNYSGSSILPSQIKSEDSQSTNSSTSPEFILERDLDNLFENKEYAKFVETFDAQFDQIPCNDSFDYCKTELMINQAISLSHLNRPEEAVIILKQATNMAQKEYQASMNQFNTRLIRVWGSDLANDPKIQKIEAKYAAAYMDGAPEELEEIKQEILIYQSLFSLQSLVLSLQDLMKNKNVI